MAIRPAGIPGLWRRRRTRRLILQAGFLAVVALVGVYFVARALDLKLDFDFLRGPGGFALSHQWLTDYGPTNTRLDAYGAGVVNTLRLVAVGLVLATVLGTLAGVARLSGNWLLARLATLYVEAVRNTPLLIQIIFWYTAVLLQLPAISENANLFDTVLISNRALALPFVDADGAFGLWVALLAIAAALAWWVRRRLLRRETERGGDRHATSIALLLFAALGGIAFAVSGTPLSADVPELGSPAPGISVVTGGVQVTPEFAAVLLGLVIYTGAYIAEIVRGSVQALPRGQSEAAAALGFSGYQRMTLVILPQALRIIIPPLTNQFLNLTKNSSLAVAIAYPDLVLVGTTIINGVGHAVPMFLVIFATYLALSLGISVVMNALNRRVRVAGA